jgi:hypothetical protein
VANRLPVSHHDFVGKDGFVLLTNSDSGGYVLYNPDLENILNRLFV